MNEQLFGPSRKRSHLLPKTNRYMALLSVLILASLVLVFSLATAKGTLARTVVGGGGICGAKFDDQNANGVWDLGLEPTLPGWTIQLEGGGGFTSTTTNADGFYCFHNLADGQYIVMEVMQPGWQQTFPDPATGGGGVHQVIINGGQQVDDINFGNHGGPRDGGVHGAKFYDHNNNGVWDADEWGLPGWTIQLDGNGMVMTTTTGGDGRYWFMDLMTGTYTVTEMLQPGWVQTFPPPPGYYTFLYVPSQSIENLNFGNWTQEFGEIHGMKFHDLDGDGQKDVDEPGLPNWTITVQGNGFITSTVTDDQGNYWFMGLPPGTYIVSELQPPPVWNGQNMIQWVQTYPQTGTHTIQLGPNQMVHDVDFGNWQGGKNDFCMIPWDNHFLDQVSLVTEIYIFNASTDPQKAYTVQLVGPSTMTVLTPTLPISLNPYQYGVVHIQIDYPNSFTGEGQWAQFQAIVTNLATNTTFTCHASLWSYSPNWWTSPNVNSGLAGGIPFGFTQAISFTVTNNGGGDFPTLAGGGAVDYRIWAMSRGMTDTAPIVSLNGLPPGSVITGQLNITPGQSVDIPVEVAFTDFVLLAPTDIIFELDVDGDGLPDMVTSHLAYIDPPRVFLPVILKP